MSKPLDCGSCGRPWAQHSARQADKCQRRIEFWNARRTKKRVALYQDRRS